MGMIKRALRRTSRKLLNKIIPPTQSHELVLNPRCSGELASHAADSTASRRKLAHFQRKFKKSASSKDTAVAEALLLAVKNHLPPLQFHHVHGQHVQLGSNRSVARRTHSFCQALVFSNRVILPNERVYLKVLEIAKCWSGTIRFGFTAVDPATLACRMPKHACPDMTEAGHTWARALADEVVRRNSVIHFSYNKHGIIHYGINNQDCGIFHANVATNQNLWFIVDIYGLTAAVELIDPRVNTMANNELNSSTFSHIHQDVATLASAEQPLTMYKSTSAMDELFGSRYGVNSVSSRRKKLSRKHARHAAQIQSNWLPLDGYTNANLLGFNYNHQHHGQPGAMQLPNLNSVTLPSVQQNIYSPMPNLAAGQRETRPGNESHDYHQIMSGTYSSGHCHQQPLQMVRGAAPPKLSASVSMANIAHSSCAPASISNRQGVPTISQADLSHELENLHLYERRMRKHAAAKAASKATPSTSNVVQGAPVAATRKRQQLQPITSNQTNNRRPSEPGRDQHLDKSTTAPSSSSSSSSAAAAAATGQRIVSNKAAGSSSAAVASCKASASSQSNVKPKTRHSIKTQKATTARDNNDNSPPNRDCPICFERPINCVLYQCGHMCTCYECGVKQWKTQSRTCPICRTVIKDVIKTYMS